MSEHRVTVFASATEELATELKHVENLIGAFDSLNSASRDAHYRAVKYLKDQVNFHLVSERNALKIAKRMQRALRRGKFFA